MGLMIFFIVSLIVSLIVSVIAAFGDYFITLE